MISVTFQMCHNIMQDSHIIATLPHDKKICIYPSNWHLFAKGEGHFILANRCKQDQLYFSVLSVCRHSIGTLPSRFEESYQNILSRFVQLQPYLLERSEIAFQEGQKDKFKEMLSSLCNFKPEQLKVFLSDNLYQCQQQWDFCLEFKPKTPLPDIYSLSFLSAFSQKHSLHREQLIECLKNSPKQQKLRWFKKNAMKVNKKNMNSLAIFGLDSPNPDYQLLIKPLHSQAQPHAISSEKIVNCLQSTNIFQNILRLQMLYLSSNDFDSTQLDKLGECPLETQDIVGKILEEIYKIQHPITAVELLLSCAPINPAAQNYSSTAEQLFRFLVSWSWRDVSLVIRLKLSSDSSQIVGSDLKIIDYELKQAQKLRTTILKDEQFLQNYLKFKNLKQQTITANNK